MNFYHKVFRFLKVIPFCITVSDLPNTLTFGGAVALPTLTGDGVIVQHNQYFYLLSCNPSSCSWEILEKELSIPVRNAVTMILPAEYKKIWNNKKIATLRGSPAS